MAQKNKGLGKGLEVLLGTRDVKGAPLAAPQDTEENEKAEIYVKTRLVEPNRDQPRKHFDNAALDELVESIRVHGIIQPLIVVRDGERYKIVAGERRWRAAKKLELKEIPVLVKDYDERQVAEISLIENIQRKDLDPIEEAEAMRALMEEYKMTQEELSERVSKSRANIANSVRLLKLPEDVKKLVSAGKLSAGHAKVLLGADSQKISSLAEIVVRESLSVRETEKLLKKAEKEPVPKKKLRYEEAYLDAAKKMKARLGTNVVIKRTKENAGKIEIVFKNLEEFENIQKHIQ